MARYAPRDAERPLVGKRASNGDAGHLPGVAGQTAEEPAVAMHGVIDLAPL